MKKEMVGREGFEPSKALPADLQSAPFDHSGISPDKKYPQTRIKITPNKLVMGLEPATC